jgi:phosphopantetheinyl transferase
MKDAVAQTMTKVNRTTIEEIMRSLCESERNWPNGHTRYFGGIASKAAIRQTCKILSRHRCSIKIGPSKEAHKLIYEQKTPTRFQENRFTDDE